MFFLLQVLKIALKVFWSCTQFAVSLVIAAPSLSSRCVSVGVGVGVGVDVGAGVDVGISVGGVVVVVGVGVVVGC